MIPIIAFVGEKRSGKTEVLKKVIQILVKRGYKVFAIKHSAHHFDLDKQGKDSFQFFEAGACGVCLLSDTKLGFYRSSQEKWSAQKIRDLFSPEADIVLVEGLKSSNLPKVVVGLYASAERLVGELKGVIAVMSKEKPSFEDKFEWFSPEKMEELADFLEDYIKRFREKREISIWVDEKELALKPFVKDIFFNTINAMVYSLKGTESAKRIQIVIENPPKSSV